MGTVVQPAWMLYTLGAVPARTGSPSEPAVRLEERGMDGEWIADHTLTPQQARDLAALLTEAADAALGGTR